jgi:hypothetical protein
MTQLRRVAIAVLVATVTCLGPGSESSAEIPSFTNDIEPVLTRYGCNSGGCHGKLAVQNGFRLSLRGYAPEADHAALVLAARGAIEDLEALGVDGDGAVELEGVEGAGELGEVRLGEGPADGGLG